MSHSNAPDQQRRPGCLRPADNHDRAGIATHGSLPAAYDTKGGYALGGLVQPGVLVRDQGGIIPPGFSTIFNGTGKDEFAFTNEQAKALLASRQGVGRTAPYIGEQHYHVHVDTDLDFAQRREEFRLTQALITV